MEKEKKAVKTVGEGVNSIELEESLVI